ncbi:unnamed protein product [Candida parapsilosis]|uniref:Uncharacterized protein n=1 Tax=Candida parapsilosis TaxID=5480 RepID=A0A8X7T9A6_CANPA|nr:hypothetical protein FOB60_005240 [Candida parapsilosis]KAF6050325.1 hypothetical protein FOB59_002571 [Candida parapsilosis]
MDNRERYQKYKDSLSGNSGSRQNSFALRSKLKSIFTSWNKPDSDEVVSSHRSTSNSSKLSQQDPGFLGTSAVKLPGSFHAYKETSNTPVDTSQQQQQQQLSPIHSTSTIDKDETAENPNDILSAFFKQKGNGKLTDVEYEGVMALMSKSRTGTPYKREFAELSFTNAEPSFKRRHLGNDSIIVGNETSIVGSTPSKQNVLKTNGNTTLNTPGYTPKYNKTYNDTFERSYSIINNTTGSHFVPSLRRASMRSRRPAPYKSRITSSTLSNSVVKNDRQTDEKDNNLSFKSSNTSAIQTSASKPPSKAAQTLLSILDGKEENGEPVDEKQQQHQDKLKLFINPYGSSSEKKNKNKLSNTLTASGVTASTIGKTISYSAMDSLPASNGEEKSNTTSTSNPKNNTGKASDMPLIQSNHLAKPIFNEPKSKSPTFSNGFHHSFSKELNGNKGDHNGENEQVVGKYAMNAPRNGTFFEPSVSNMSFTASGSLSVNGVSNKESNSSGDKHKNKSYSIDDQGNGENLRRKLPNTFGSSCTPTPAFESIKSSTDGFVSTTNQLNGTNNESSPLVSEFTFPSPKLVVYDFDEEEVNRYKSLFSF